jgi:hypothetical protein
MQVAAGGIVRQQTIFSGSIHRTQRSKRLMYAPSIVHRAQLAINRVSDNAGGVKHFLSVLLRALPRARHFALVEAFAFAVALAFAIPTKVRS